MEQKRHLFEVQINSISDTDNPTKKEVEFILHDFLVSHNYAFISKETAQSSLETLKDMPIVAKYYDKTHHTENDDALGSHEVQFERDRNDGEAIVTMGTLPIGVFTEPAYISTVNIDGEDREVVMGKGVLWASRFPNIVGLLKEWVDRGVPVTSSMEILYNSYKVEDGITEILSYCYEGHCLLNSEDRGDHKKVYPAYDVSKLTKLVAQAIEQENEKEDEKVEEVKETVVEEELESKETVEPTSETESQEKQSVETQSDKVVESENDEKNKSLSEKELEIKNLKEELQKALSEKEELEKEFNKISEKVIELTSQVNELKPFKEQVDKENFEKALSNKKEFYAAKFAALNASDKFNDEEVQSLIQKTVYENEEGKQATLQLNSMLVEMVDVVKEFDKKENPIREISSKRENLIPTSDDFDSRYSL